MSDLMNSWTSARSAIELHVETLAKRVEARDKKIEEQEQRIKDLEAMFNLTQADYLRASKDNAYLIAAIQDIFNLSSGKGGAGKTLARVRSITSVAIQGMTKK